MNGQGLDPGSPTQRADLFGPVPGADPLAHYRPPDPAADIYAGASPAIAENWRAFAAGLAAQCQCNLGTMQPYLDRHVEDLGMAFRLTGDEHERPWPLNPMPIIIGSAEWEGIETGLIQRAELLEQVIADIYGAQTLITGGHLPAAVVSGSANFARGLHIRRKSCPCNTCQFAKDHRADRRVALCPFQMPSDMVRGFMRQNKSELVLVLDVIQ